MFVGVRAKCMIKEETSEANHSKFDHHPYVAYHFQGVDEKYFQ
jgi:hypothetical protein